MTLRSLCLCGSLRQATLTFIWIIYFSQVPKEEEYERLVEILDCLIDQFGEDESHPLASLMEVIGVLIENYETEHIPQLEEIV